MLACVMCRDTVFISAPAVINIVAQVWRNVYKVTCLLIPAAFTQSLKGFTAIDCLKSLKTKPCDLGVPQNLRASLLIGMVSMFLVLCICLLIIGSPSAPSMISDQSSVLMSAGRRPLKIASAIRFLRTSYSQGVDKSFLTSS